MELQKALSQISEIHAQVLKTELFRGYRAVTMAATGAVAVIAAAVQEAWVQPATPDGFATFWLSVAVVCASVCAVDLWLRSRNAPDRHRTALALKQFLPALVGGAAATPILLRFDHPGPALLPGVWVLIYALGIFASRPYLPRAIGWIAIYYLAAGLVLLAGADRSAVPSGWGMGLTFGVGQAALAWVLHRDLERGVVPGGVHGC